MVLTYKSLNQLGTEDVIAVSATQQNGSKWAWDVNKNFSLPSNATKVLALQPVAIEWMSDDDPEVGVKTPAVAFLYTQAEDTRLSVMTVDKHRNTFHPVCPPGSKTLAGVSADNGYTDLLVGGTDLYYFPYGHLTKKNMQGQRLLSDPARKFDCTNELFVAHSTANKSISIWGEGANQGISYLIPDSLTKNTKTPVPLIPDKKGGPFTAFKAANAQMEQYIYHSGEKEVSILEMDPASGFWKTVPLMIPTMDQMVKFQAHVTHVVVRDRYQRPLPNRKLQLKSANRVSVLVNGKAVVSAPGQHGVLVTTDSRGCLSITTPTGSLFSEPFTLVDPEASISQDIDPNTKVKNALRRVSNSQELAKEDVLLKYFGHDSKKLEKLATVIGCMMSVIDGKPIAMAETYGGTDPQEAVYLASYGFIDNAIDLGHVSSVECF